MNTIKSTTRNTKEYVEKSMALVALCNKAKDQGSHEVANLAFGHVLSAALDRPKDFKIWVETDDPNGECEPEAYYDVVCLSIDGMHACIPVPLLDPKTVAVVYKAAAQREDGFIPRQAHKREEMEYMEYIEEAEIGLLTEYVNMHMPLFSALLEVDAERRIQKLIDAWKDQNPERREALPPYSYGWWRYTGEAEAEDEELLGEDEELLGEAEDEELLDEATLQKLREQRQEFILDDDDDDELRQNQ